MPPKKYAWIFSLPPPHSIEKLQPGQFSISWGQLGFPPEAQTNLINSDGSLKQVRKYVLCTCARDCSTCPKALLEVLEAFVPHKELADASTNVKNEGIHKAARQQYIPAGLHLTLSHYLGVRERVGFVFTVSIFCLSWAGI